MKKTTLAALIQKRYYTPAPTIRWIQPKGEEQNLRILHNDHYDNKRRSRLY